MKQDYLHRSVTLELGQIFVIFVLLVILLT